MRTVLIAAQSLDGFIANSSQPGTAFTSPEDKLHFRTAVADFDVGVLGGETYRVSREAIRAQTAARHLRVVVTRSPERHATDAIPGILEFTRAAPAELAHELRVRGFRRCALLGGSQIHSLFLAAGLVDEIWMTIEPLLFGAGTPLLARQTDTRLELHAIERLGANAVLVKYNVIR